MVVGVEKLVWMGREQESGPVEATVRGLVLGLERDEAMAMGPVRAMGQGVEEELGRVEKQELAWE